MNYFDVAPGYGDAQELMGEGLRSYRKNVFLACKTKYRNQLDSTNDLNNSLKLLKTDYFDLYQLHGMKTYNDYQNVVSKDGALKTLIEAKEKGKVRYIGFSCHSIEVAKLLINEDIFDSILFPVNWGLMIKDHYNYIILGEPFLAVIPGICIMLLVCSFMILGNSLRDFLDVKNY